jgi:hypothetical protein
MSKKTFMATIIFTVLLVSLVIGLQTSEVANANPYWGVYPAEPTQDKPILVIESPGNHSSCSKGNVTLNLTIIKPSSWNMTVAPFGTCANGRIDSVNVSLNGLQEFQEFLYFNDLNGGGSWNKSYSLNLGELHLGLNAVQVIVSALALSSIRDYPMNVTSTLYLKYSAISPPPTQSLTPSISPSEAPTQQPTPTPIFTGSYVIADPGEDYTPSLIALSTIIVIVVLGVAAYIYFRKRRTNSNQTSWR